MQVGIAADHGGLALKTSIKNEFKAIQWQDFGTSSDESVDYPDYAQVLCKAILNEEIERGILICGTGIGISIAANRFKGIRAALCHDAFTAEMARRHNDANVLALGGRVLDLEMAFRIVRLFLDTEFEGGRHQRRVQKIEQI
ncbi:MAG: ribose 5-phosphate isomerase B [Leptospiraceae bacterium]|nr:ribose 5-phosphate isomerase B [Leptospiraceae bacterium]MCB1201011.1 ribose 5-phosphate isomerase B [Leptospiraceae bacterium]